MKKSSKSFRTPKGCIVAWAKITNGGVEIGYRCPDASGYRSENLHAFAKGARSIHFPGGEVEGMGARAGFVLSPEHVRCEKTASSSTLTCRVFNAGGAELSGLSESKFRAEMRRRLESSINPKVSAHYLRMLNELQSKPKKKKR
jgi:hypothetical protein